VPRCHGHGPGRVLATVPFGAAGAVLVAALVALAPVPAGAQQDPVGVAQARADRAANTYLDALIRSLELNAEIAGLEQELAGLEVQITDLRGRARGRAVEAYKRSGTPVEVQFADDATEMDSARRTVLLDKVNARDNHAAQELGDARDDRRARQQELKAVEQEHADLLNRLKQEEDRLDSELLAAQNARRGPAAPPVDRLAPSADYAPRPGEHPQHNSHFLVCTRGIESGGNYRAYNGSGPYLGAYQFLQSTWNSTANHAGRGELVGVDPRDASEYDQDDMAWTLYEWKGKAPWNGRC
jgi:Transglycosylase-like domain